VPAPASCSPDRPPRRRLDQGSCHTGHHRPEFATAPEWLPRRFDPQRALATPRSIAALLGPNPRVIADEVWAKLLWADLNLDIDDLPVTKAGHFYPLELVRAVTLT
jgi:hypothetical protein